MADSRPKGDHAVPGEDVKEPRDPFRWLEDRGSPRTQAWLASQRTLLDCHARREQEPEAAWRHVLAEIETAAAGRALTPPVEAGGLLFRHELTAEGAEVLSSSAADSPGSVLLNTSGHPSVSRLAGWQPDPRGCVVAAQLHHDGYENGGLHLIPVGGGAEPGELSDASPHPAVAFLGGLLLYSSGTRTEHTLRAHHLGCGSTRTVELPVAGPVRISLHTGADGLLLLRTRALGTSSAHWWCTRWTGGGTPDWQPLPFEGRRITACALGADELYVAGPRDLFVLHLSRVARGDAAKPLPLASAAQSHTASAGEIQALRMLGSRTDPHLSVLRRSGTVRRLEIRRVIGAAGVPTGGDADEAPVHSFTWHARLRLGPTSHDRDGRPGDSLWFLADDPLHGAVSHRVTPGSPVEPASRRSALRTLTATSRDGTTLPITICDPPSRTRNEPAPTLVTVYGGFGVPLEPSWDPIFAAWLSAGGRIAWVHARGGGEFGPDWVAAGRGPGKSDTVDDLCAAARTLHAEGGTGHGRLAALAASNGGLVLSAALVRAPHLFSAVACAAPLTDMARYHEGGGLGELWREEYGDPTDPEGLRALLKYSPYHHVRAGDGYPAAVFITGGNDARVRPWHAWKLCAALQEATGGESPILLDHQENTGHYGRAGGDARSLSARVLALLATRTGLGTPPVGPSLVPAPSTRSTS
ncbi:prolyl oligopeptidase family serine peptidase [Streptomyces sp. NPDC006992]|uniref:prolyl oligopeptidase family serine peptidase n=1 Tax=Streptomyces sp. NPDC006992 TaxID=3155601 RepID=UPI003408C473